MSNHVRIRDAKRGGTRYYKLPRNRAKRSRTFKTEEAAHAWAKANGAKEYTLRNLKSPESSTKKIVIEAKE